jgi:hypothetical protein
VGKNLRAVLGASGSKSDRAEKENKKVFAKHYFLRSGLSWVSLTRMPAVISMELIEGGLRN